MSIEETPVLRFAAHVHGPVQIYAIEERHNPGVYRVAQMGGGWDQRIHFAGAEEVPDGVTPEALLSVVMDRVLRVDSSDPRPGTARAIKFMGLAIEALLAARGGE